MAAFSSTALNCSACSRDSAISLLVDFLYGGGVAFGHGGVAELGVHLGVFVGFAFNRELEGLGRAHAGLGVEEVQVAEGVHHFLFGGGFEGPGGVFVAHLPAQLGEVAVLDVGLVETALITPPVGMNLFVVQLAQRRLDECRHSRGSQPFVLALFAMVALLAVFPDLAMWLPRVFAG